MPVKKLSQIATAPSPPAPTDQLVGVQGGVADVLFPISQISSGATYLVGTGGNFTTIAQVNAATFAPGDSILFQGGQTFSGAIISPSGGTPANPITFGSYGGGQATISSGNSNGFTSTNQSGIIVRDLTFTGTASTNRGIYFNASQSSNVRFQNIAVINCIVSGYGQGGINIYGTDGTTSGYDDVLIDGCIVSGCCSVADGAHLTGGILIENYLGGGLAANPATHTNVTVLNCVSHDNAGATAGNATGNGIVVTETIIGLIYGCTAYNNGASSNSSANNGPAGIWTEDSQYVVIDTCESYLNSTANGHDGNGFDIDSGCLNCTIRNCFSHDNSGGGFISVASAVQPNLTINNNNSIINCVSKNDGTDGSHASIAITNNTTMTNLTLSGCQVYQTNAGPVLSIAGSAQNSITGLVSGNDFIQSGSQTFITTTGNPTGLLFIGNNYSPLSGSTFNITWNGTTYVSPWTWFLGTGQEPTGTGINFVRRNFQIVGSGASLDLVDTETNGEDWTLGSEVVSTHPVFFVYQNTADRTDLVINLDAAGSMQIRSGSVFGWSSNANHADSGAMDTGISRQGANTIAFGDGTPGDGSATLAASKIALSSAVAGMGGFDVNNTAHPNGCLIHGTTDGNSIASLSLIVSATGEEYQILLRDNKDLLLFHFDGSSVFTGGLALTPAGSVIAGPASLSAAAIATTATDGFLYIPTCAGTPTGTPTSQAGTVPFVYDTTNNQLWIYAGAWKQPKTLVGAGVVDWQ